MMKTIMQTYVQTILTTLLSMLMVLLSCSSAQAGVEITYFYTDLLGSPVVATDQNGVERWYRDREPYGTRREGGALSGHALDVDEYSLQYTGQSEDYETGLTYHGARYYNSDVGRFYAIDPVGFNTENIHSFNRYAYANNNPYTYVDLTGLEPGSAATYGPAWNDESGDSYQGSDGGYYYVDAVIGSDSLTDSALYTGSGALTVLSFGAWSVGVKPLVGSFRSFVSNLFTGGGKQVTKGGDKIIGRTGDLSNTKLVKPRESPLDVKVVRNPDGSINSKATWKSNSSVLRKAMSEDQPIRDVSPGDTRGQFLNAERNLLESRGWTFDKSSNYWNPPRP